MISNFKSILSAQLDDLAENNKLNVVVPSKAVLMLPQQISKQNLSEIDANEESFIQEQSKVGDTTGIRNTAPKLRPSRHSHHSGRKPLKLE